MNEEHFKVIADQLRMPHGKMAREVGEKMNESNWLMNIETINQLDLKEKDNVLEIGMGNGFFVKYVLSAHQTINYTGYDFSEDMVREARRYNQYYVKKSRVRFSQTEAQNLPCANRIFNKVFTVNTIYFWQNNFMVLSEIRRVLKEGGKFVLSLRPRSVMNDFPIAQYGFNFFSKADAVNMLLNSGFKINNIIEKEESDIDFFGRKLKNGFMIIEAQKI